MTLRSSADPETQAAQPHRHVFETVVRLEHRNGDPTTIYLECLCGLARRLDIFAMPRPQDQESAE